MIHRAKWSSLGANGNFQAGPRPKISSGMDSQFGKLNAQAHKIILQASPHTFPARRSASAKYAHPSPTPRQDSIQQYTTRDSGKHRLTLKKQHPRQRKIYQAFSKTKNDRKVRVLLGKSAKCCQFFRHLGPQTRRTNATSEHLRTALNRTQGDKRYKI